MCHSFNSVPTVARDAHAS
ncbi:MAG: hypothetical protein DWH97_10800 [Planctomycetota bacterium]|nr:MAG: hypothetical protein DWH97_10800 [Planctomycetota bacterium]RLS92309.1 MAG: hypothetical protein DWI12_11500 [Planctomycetota bacterium]